MTARCTCGHEQIEHRRDLFSGGDWCAGADCECYQYRPAEPPRKSDEEAR